MNTHTHTERNALLSNHPTFSPSLVHCDLPPRECNMMSIKTLYNNANALHFDNKLNKPGLINCDEEWSTQNLSV